MMTERRIRRDNVHCIRDCVDEFYPRVKKIRLVQDDLNTHNGASLNEIFPVKEARRISDTIEFHHTPKHSSWLNITKPEIDVMNCECLDRRLLNKRLMAKEVVA
jgi:hypothetical protein